MTIYTPTNSTLASPLFFSCPTAIAPLAAIIKPIPELNTKQPIIQIFFPGSGGPISPLLFKSLTASEGLAALEFLEADWAWATGVAVGAAALEDPAFSLYVYSKSNMCQEIYNKWSQI